MNGNVESRYLLRLIPYDWPYSRYLQRGNNEASCCPRFQQRRAPYGHRFVSEAVPRASSALGTRTKPLGDRGPSLLFRTRVCPLRNHCSGLKYIDNSWNNNVDWYLIFFFTVSNGQTGRNHVRVADRFNFVHVVTFDPSVEQFVDRVEERDNLWMMR